MGATVSVGTTTGRAFPRRPVALACRSKVAFEYGEDMNVAVSGKAELPPV